mgnify:CR=1 FL=1
MSMRLVRPLLWLLLACLLGIQAVQVVGQVMNPSWIPYNGYFQNANPVERLCLGQWPGRDFDPYLGLGTPWLAWALSPIFGCDPQGTDAAYQLLTRILLAAALAGIGWAAGLQGRGTLVLFSGLMLAQAGFGGLLPLIGVPTLQILNPAASLFGIRVATPLLLVVLAAAALSRLPGHRGWAITGGAAALAALLAPDSGAAALAGIAALLLVDHWHRHRLALRPLLLGAAAAASAYAAVLALGGLLLTGGRLDLWLGWLLWEMRTAQGWIFSYDPDALAAAWHRPLRHPASILLVLLAILLARHNDARPVALAGVATAALVAAWVPYLGGMQNERYLSAVELVLATLAAAATVRLLSTERIRAIAALAGVAVTLPISLLVLPIAIAPWKADSVPTPWGGRSHPSWQPLWDIGAEMRAAGGHLVSLYRGPLARASGTPPTGRQDYLIHAFRAKDLESWRQAVAEARWVVTLAPEAILFGRWMERVYWPVLREAYLGHIPHRDVGPLRLWNTRPARLTPDGRAVACRIGEDGILRLSADGVLEPFLAEIHVEIPSAAAPMAVERSPAILSHTPAGSYALPPGRTRHVLPVDLVPGAETTVEIRNGPGRLLPSACAATLFLPRARLAPPPGPTPDGPHQAQLRTWTRLDGTSRHGLLLTAEDPMARPPRAGERIDACPHLAIRHVQWTRENSTFLVLEDDRTAECLSDRARATVRLLPPESPR